MFGVFDPDLSLLLLSSLCMFSTLVSLVSAYVVIFLSAVHCFNNRPRHVPRDKQ